MADALGTEGEVVGRLQEEARTDRSTASPYQVSSSIPQRQEVATEVIGDPITASEQATGVAERNPEGMLARIKAILLGPGDDPHVTDAAADAAAEPPNLKEEPTREEPGTDMTSEATREEVSAEETREEEPVTASVEENEKLRHRVAELEEQVQTLTEHNAQTALALANQRVDAQVVQDHAAGVPKYLTTAARPDLLEAALDASNQAAQERAERWRTTLDAAKGTVEFGERGSADGESTTELSDHQIIQKTLADRQLGPEHYEAVAVELAAKGEIRKEG